MSTPLQAPEDGAPAASTPLHPRVEIGAGVGLTDQSTGVIPRLRAGATLQLDVPHLVLGADLAGEAFFTGEENAGFGTRSYWEAMLTPRMFAGYEVDLQSFSLVPYGYLAVSGGMRVTTVRFFGRTDDTTAIALGGRLGLGVSFVVQMLMVSLELDAGLKDLGPSGSGTINVGLNF